jgi:hypothetical protein
LRPREFFSRPWSGEGDWRPRYWLRRIAPPRRLRFRSFTTWLTEELWVVHDETVWDDGRVERRDGLATLIAPDRIRLTYDDMPGGTEIRLHRSGYALSPYLMAIALPVSPLPLLVRCVDRCQLDPEGYLLDTIELSLLGVRLGQQTMRLRREEGDTPL